VKETARKLKDGECLLKDVDVHEVSYRLITEDSDGSSDEWIIVQRLGFDNPDQVPDSVNSAYNCRDFALLPRGGVAYRTTSNHKRGNNPSQLFCFLPLPIQLQLPVSINGDFVLDYETRRHLWSSEMADYETEWNNCLMEKIVAPAYSDLKVQTKFLTVSIQHITAKILHFFHEAVLHTVPRATVNI